MDKRHQNWQGMNWIRQEKRLAIYLRDNLACVWCGQGVEQGVQFTLDHLKPHSLGGSNEHTNLVTACVGCNSARGKRSVREFAKAVAGYVNHGVTAQDVEKHVRTCAALGLAGGLGLAKAMIAARGSVAKALYPVQEVV